MLQYTFDISTFEYFLLILVRISCFVFVAPFFGAKEVPGRVKIGLSAFVAILVFYAVPVEQYEHTPCGMSVMPLLVHQRGNYRIADRFRGIYL